MVEIRNMRREDIPEVASIHRSIMRGTSRHVNEEDIEIEFGDLMNSYPEGCIVAVDGGRVVGFIMATQKHWGFGLGVSGWVEVVGVHPDHMGTGVGKAMGEAVVDHFRQEGIDEVYTAVKWDSGDLITFFKSIGFGRSEFINLKYTRRE